MVSHVETIITCLYMKKKKKPETTYVDGAEYPLVLFEAVGELVLGLLILLAHLDAEVALGQEVDDDHLHLGRVARHGDLLEEPLEGLA
jgi:hypothetical protein